MGRNLDAILDTLSDTRRDKIAARTEELVAEVEGLKALRKLAAHSQTDIARALGVKQPSVHKIESQTDLYLSTLRKFIEAAGGTLELRVALPGKGVVNLTKLGDLRA